MKIIVDIILASRTSKTTFKPPYYVDVDNFELWELCPEQTESLKSVVNTINSVNTFKYC